MIYPPMTNKLKILIDAVVKWSNVFVIKIKCIEHEYEILLRDRASLAYIPTAVGNTVHQWKFRYCLSV